MAQSHGALFVAALFTSTLGLGCTEDTDDDLGPYRAPPTMPRPGCRTTDVMAIPVGDNLGYRALDQSLAEGRVPPDWEITSNQAFGRSLDIEGACCDDDLCVEASLATVPDLDLPGPQAVLQVSLVTGLEAVERPQAERTVVLLVDASASLLSQQRIESVKAALQELADSIEDEAQLGLLTFDAEAQVLVPTGPATQTRTQVKDAIDALEAGGGTNLAVGLQAAFFEADRVFDNTREHRVMMVTDGNDPRGQQDAEFIARDLTPFFAKGIQLTVFGVGTSDEQAWLYPLTERADGRFLEDEGGENLGGLVMDELARRYTPVATELELRIRPPAGAIFSQAAGWAPPVRSDGVVRAVLSAVLLGPEGDIVTLGQSGESGPAMVVDLEPVTGDPGEVDVVLNYNPVGAGSRKTQRAYVDLPAGWPDIDAPGETSNLAAREALFARHVGDTIKTAVDLWSGGQRADALELIVRLEAMIQDYPDGRDGPDADVVADLQRVQQLRRRMESGTSARPTPQLPDDPWPGE